ncbi:MAG TPA: hypothetical protein VF170_13390 [Planctomycetaceae bacterium]
MTFVGKVLVVVQLVLAVCFMAFAGAVYTAETNWRNEAVEAQKQAQQARADANTATQQAQQLRAELGGQVEQLNQRVALLDSQVKQTTDQLKRTEQERDAARTAVDRATAVANIAEEQARFRQEETLRQRERNERLQAQINDLLAKNRNLEDTLFTQNREMEAMQARQEEMIEQVALYRDMILALGGSLKAEDYPQLVSKRDPPPSITGRVLNTEVSPTSRTEFVEVSVGSDDGFQKGHTLEVFRGDQYLGKIELTMVEPDRSVGKVIQRVRNGTIQKGDNVTPRL